MTFFGARRILLGLTFLFAASAHVDSQLHGHDNSESSFLEDSSSSVYVVKPAQGKGLGVFASRDLPRGTKIIIEEPLFRVTLPEVVPGKGFPVDEMMESITSSFHNLDQEQQEEYLSLHEHRFSTETDPHLPIFRSNSYNTGSDEVGLFPKIARINHSCRPNAGNWWSVKKDERVIYAARDIEEGEEITTSYIPLLKSTKERRERLTQYGFFCGCEACSESGDGKSDRRRRKIGELLSMLEAELYPKERTEKGMKRLAEKSLSLIELVKEEGLTDYLARSYHLAAVFTPDAKTWAEKELALHKLAEEDSDEALSTAEFLSRLNP